jgi:hypothetical protein
MILLAPQDRRSKNAFPRAVLSRAGNMNSETCAASAEIRLAAVDARRATQGFD